MDTYIPKCIKTESVNNDKLIIHTGFSDKQAEDVLNSVRGQISDGIWENSPGMDKYWMYMRTEVQGGEIVVVFDTDSYGSGFRGKDEQQIRRWLANKIKQIVKEEGLDWDRNNTKESGYLNYHSGCTVQDAYRVYDRILGRKDYISAPSDEESKEEPKNNVMIYTYEVYVDGEQPMMFTDDVSMSEAKRQYITDYDGKGHDISEVKVHYLDTPVVKVLDENKKLKKESNNQGVTDEFKEYLDYWLDENGYDIRDIDDVDYETILMDFAQEAGFDFNDIYTDTYTNYIDRQVEKFIRSLDESKSLKESTEHFKSLDRIEIQNTLNNLLKQRGINTDITYIGVYKDNSDYAEHRGTEIIVELLEKNKEDKTRSAQIEELIHTRIADKKDADWLYSRLEEIYKQIQNGVFDKYKVKSLNEATATEVRFNNTLEQWKRLGYKPYKEESKITVLVNDTREEPIAIAFRGKSSTPIWHYKFKTKEELDDYVNRTIENDKTREQWKADRREKTKVTRDHNIKIGDIFYTSWGYDQTNSEFYEVVDVRGSRIDLKELAHNTDNGDEDWGVVHITPIPGKYVNDKIYTVSAKADGNVTNLEGRSFLNLYKYDGQPIQVTATGWGH